MRGEWRVEIRDKPSPAKISAAVRDELEGLLEELREDGQVAGAKPLSGYEGVYSARFNRSQWRIVYAVHRRARFVQVLRIEPRGTVYEGLKRGSQR